MTRKCFATACAAIGLSSLLLGTAQAQQIFSGSGASATSAFDDFRNAIGGGRRIAWDGVRLDGTDANPNTVVIDSGHTVAIPVDRFQNVGALFADPYAVSGDQFASVNPATSGQFNFFSPNNTFAMFDANSGQFEDRFIEQNFTFPGTANAAGTRGFGAIFNDVELAGSSSIEYFGRDLNNNKVSLGKFDVATGASGESEFLGVLFDQSIVTDVTLTVGTHALFSFDGTTLSSFGPQNLANGIDLAITDDFVFAEPTQFTAVPEPSTAVLIASGMALLAAQRLRRLRRK